MSKKYYDYNLPYLFEAITQLLQETSGETWKSDVARALAVAEIGAEYSHGLAAQTEEGEGQAALAEVTTARASTEMMA